MNFLLIAALICVTPQYSTYNNYSSPGPSNNYYSPVVSSYRLYVLPDPPKKPIAKPNRVVVEVRSFIATFWTYGICVKSAKGQSLIITDFNTIHRGSKVFIDDEEATLISTDKKWVALVIDAEYPVAMKNFYKFKFNELKEFPQLGD